MTKQVDGSSDNFIGGLIWTTTSLRGPTMSTSTDFRHWTHERRQNSIYATTTS